MYIECVTKEKSQEQRFGVYEIYCIFHLQIYSIPDYKIVYYVKNFPLGQKLLVDSVQITDKIRYSICTKGGIFQIQCTCISLIELQWLPLSNIKLAYYDLCSILSFSMERDFKFLIFKLFL